MSKYSDQPPQNTQRVLSAYIRMMFDRSAEAPRHKLREYSRSIVLSCSQSSNYVQFSLALLLSLCCFKDHLSNRW